jgi:hypothetical protein
MFTQIKWVESGKALKALGGLFDRRIFGIFDRHGEEARLSRWEDAVSLASA